MHVCIDEARHEHAALCRYDLGVVVNQRRDSVARFPRWPGRRIPATASRAVVGLVNATPAHVQVVVDRRGRCLAGIQVLRAREVGYVEHVGSCGHAEVEFVQFVADEQEAMILSQPRLVHETELRVRYRRGYPDRVNVCDADVALVRVETDLAAHEIHVRSLVHHALRIVRIRRHNMASREHRVAGITEIDHVQAATAGVCADRVGESSSIAVGARLWPRAQRGR